MADIKFLYSTTPDMKTANEIAGALVEARLAACVNLLPAMQSIYRWKGAIERAQEIVLIVKTTADAAAAARDKILELHPADTPCVAAFDIERSSSNSSFLDWIANETIA